MRGGVPGVTGSYGDSLLNPETKLRGCIGCSLPRFEPSYPSRLRLRSVPNVAASVSLFMAAASGQIR
jgi:hypothetical protein